MAKADNIFNIRGRLGDFIFCQRNGKTYVKRYSGGFTKAATQNHPNIKVGQERFAQVSRYVKSLKQQLQPYLWRQKDGTFHNQLMATFLQIAKNETEKTFNELIHELDSYSSLSNKSLNKNSKIDPSTLLYDAKTNKLNLGIIPYELAVKYKGLFLEVATGWYGVNDGEIFLTESNRQYVKLDGQTKNEDQLVDFAPADDLDGQLPFVGLAVVYTDDATSESPHPVHTVMACFVETRNG
ncbi:hypothetical protein [Paenimyroides baculatum]|uniref:Uncharacterized protein n=1 Tax=Paenimyroides baculatum TaxID=2608000 RepID=A0A5M6CHT4_9FLAO|nr:hypothetical protein [Paenimyroides baculatum]KAA5533980.1 hypothetical protein F0460_11645 [Paenimyroides baculatum]